MQHALDEKHFQNIGHFPGKCNLFALDFACILLRISYLIVLTIVASRLNLFLIITVSCVLFFNSVAGLADPLAEPDRALDSLRTELERIEGKLKEAETHEEDLASELEMLEQKVQLQNELVRRQRRNAGQIEDSLSLLNAEIFANESALWDLAARLESLNSDRDNWGRSLARTLLTEHRMGEWAGLELIAGSESWREVAERRRLVGRLKELESNAIGALVRLSDSLEIIESTVNQQTLALTNHKDLLTAQSAEATRLEKQLRTDEKMLVQEKSALRKQLQKAQGNRELLTSRQEEIEQAKTAMEELMARVAQGEAITGVPLQLLKGQLPWPVGGTVVEKFGLVRNQLLETTTENPGIEVAASDEAAVSSVADGRVSSVTWLRGFGNVCIIEHPGAYYTVYARLNRVTVAANEQVAAGSLLGYPAYDAESEQYRVHFEIWSGRDKKDPLDWLQPQ